MKYVLYGHNGSSNHGCEAIVKTFLKTSLNGNEKTLLLSYNPQNDYPYATDKLVDQFSGYFLYSKTSPWRVYTLIRERLFHNKDIRYKVFLKNVKKQFSKGDIAFSIGGDNYCYPLFPETLASYNRIFHEYGLKTVLYGCSIEPEVLQNDAVVKDMKLYDLIITREPLTYNALIAAGVVNNVRKVPDTAFLLDKKELPLPDGFIPGNTVGINLSPRVGLTGPNHECIFEAYDRLIDYILKETDMSVALIPHVVSEGTDDRLPLKMLKDRHRDDKRVILINDGTCEEIKGYISRCRFMVAARTHASIAAYSTCVPTLVTGYSIKSKGIAIDLFGTTENYVIPDIDINYSDAMVDRFKWLQNNEQSIRKHLVSIMPEYKNRVTDIKRWIKEIQG